MFSSQSQCLSPGGRHGNGVLKNVSSLCGNVASERVHCSLSPGRTVMRQMVGTGAATGRALHVTNYPEQQQSVGKHQGGRAEDCVASPSLHCSAATLLVSPQSNPFYHKPQAENVSLFGHWGSLAVFSFHLHFNPENLPLPFSFLPDISVEVFSSFLASALVCCTSVH